MGRTAPSRTDTVPLEPDAAHRADLLSIAATFVKTSKTE